MTLILGNPAGLWALLGLPVVLAIHFLQPRSRRVVITTLFLLEHLPPMATTGRAWRWLRSSWALWLQLLAVTLIAWLLAEPRWLRSDSVQTIAIVLDASASMRAFREDAIAALRERMPIWEHGTARTEWVVRETDLARPLLYRGYDRDAALAALVAGANASENAAPRWHPDLGTHDFAPALAVASRLVRRAGAAVLVTDRRPTAKLEGVALLAVGHPLENAGFAGGSVSPDDNGKPRWTILAQNHGRTAATRTLTIAQRDGTAVRSEEISLEPGRLLTLSGAFPEGADALVFKLSGDAFDLDDMLPLVVPQPHALTWRVTGGDENATKFFRRFFERAPALVAAADGAMPDIAIVASDALPADNNNSNSAGVAPVASLLEVDVVATAEKPGRVATAPIVNESHPWIEGLAWSGLLGGGPLADALPHGARALLWQGEKPLAWLDAARGVPRLVLAWDWPASNADRLPASAVLLHRLVDDARQRKLAPETINVDAGQPLALAPAAFEGDADARWTLRIDGADARRITATNEAALRAPTTPGFFSLQRGEETLIAGAAQFADPREADFADAITAAEPEQLALDVLEARTTPDRLRPLWLLLLGAVLIASWAAQAPRRATVVQKGAT